MPDASQGWGCDAPDDLLIELWDTEAAVFDRGSGETHMLSALPAEILRVLKSEKHSAQETGQRVSALYDLPLDGALEQRIRESLAQLARLGLVRCDTREA